MQLKGHLDSEADTIDKLMAINPQLAEEIKSVALVQKQNQVLKKANHSLRTQMTQKIGRLNH